MDFSAEQEDLRGLVRNVLGKRAVRSREPGSYDPALWSRLVELGLIELAADPALAVERGIVLEEAGRALLALPYLGTAVAAPFVPPSLRNEVATIHCGSALTAGAATTAMATTVDGTIDGVPDGDIAAVVVVTAVAGGVPGLYAVRLDAPGVTRTPTSTLDHSRPTATLTFEAAPAQRLPASPDEALDALHLALAVESLGVAAESLAATVAHLRTRHQFGRPLASFQALRHRIADLAVTLEAARSTVWYALRTDPAERPVLAPMAKLVAADAAYAVTTEAIQLHGGIGFTWEHDAHRYLKRATVTRLTHGEPVVLRRTIAARAGLLGP